MSYRSGSATLFVLTILLFNLSSVYAGSFDTTNVKAVNADTFRTTILGSEKASVVAFFAPWCGHCQRLAPEYEKAAKNMKGFVNFAAIDCDQDSNRSICGQYQVKGFPTLKLFPGKPKTSPKDYDGPRTAKALADHAADNMPSYVKKLKTTADVETVLQGARSKPISILFTSASTVTPLYKALSTDFHSNMDLYIIKDSAQLESIKSNLGILKAPSLIVLKPGEQQGTLFQGKLNYDSLFSFLLRYARAGSSVKSEL